MAMKVEAMTAPFDTLELARQLQAAGFEQDKAAGMSAALAKTFAVELATKRDIGDVRRDLADAKRDIEQTLTIRLGGMMVVSVGVIVAVLGYLIRLP